MKPLPTFKQLRYLVALAERRHFGRAAESCHVTQSTLSAGIQELETLLGTALVDRTRRSVLFTPVGEELVERARRLLGEAADFVAAAEAAREPLTGALRLGVIPTVAPFLLPRVLPHLRRAYPRLKLYLREDLSARLADDLGRGRLDVLLLALPYDCGDTEAVTLFEDRFSLACRRDHRLADAACVTLDELAVEPPLLLADGHCLRDHALEACRLVPKHHQSAFEATSLHTLVQMVDNGLGVTLLPQIAIEAGILEGTDLVIRPLADGQPSRRIGLVWRRGAGRHREFVLLADFFLSDCWRRLAA
jgi:LysR family hydrogen peroxide-inducible transcriptional activator